MQGIRHKAALSLLALALTLYAGGKLCSPGARFSAGSWSRGPVAGESSDVRSVTNGSLALRIGGQVLSSPPTNVLVTSVFDPSAFPSNSLLVLSSSTSIESDEWTQDRMDLIPGGVTCLVQSVTFAGTLSPCRFFKTTVRPWSDESVTNADGSVAFKVADPFEFDLDVSGVFLSRTFPVGRFSPFTQFFLSSSPSGAADWATMGISAGYSDSSGETHGGLPTRSCLGERLELSTNGISSVTVTFDRAGPRVGLDSPLYLIRYEPRISFPGLPTCAGPDGRTVCVATECRDIRVDVDRSDRPSATAVSLEEYMANPFCGVNGLSWDWEESSVSAVPGYYRLRDGTGLLVLDPEVKYGESHEYQGTRLVADDGERREVSAYPLDSPCLWEHWHEGTNAVGSAACSCVPSLDLNADVSVFPALTTSLVSDGETATGKVFLDGREIWSGNATHSRYSEFGGRSDALTEDGCSCSAGCAEGDCAALEGPSLGSVRFRIPLGVPRDDQVSGFLWFESAVPFMPSCGDFRLLCRSDASVRDVDRFDIRTVTCNDCRGRTVEITETASGVDVRIVDTATGELDCTWGIVCVGQTMRFRKFSRLGNLMSDKSYCLSSGVWSETDNVSSVSTVRTVSGGLRDWDGRWTETVSTCGPVTGSHVRVRSDLIGWGQDALVRETERWEKGAGGCWKKSCATYWDSVGRRHGQLRMTWGDDREWSWHDYDEIGRETLRLDQRNGSEAPSDADYSLTRLPAESDAFATVMDYGPLDGDSNHANDTDKVRTLSRYVVGNGAPTLVERTWTKYVHAMTNGLPCVVVTTVRACSQDAACGDPGNAVTVSVSYDAESPIVPYALRGETVAYTDEDGVTELYGHTLAGGVLRTVSQRVKGAAEAKTRTVIERDATHWNVLYEATQLAADPSVEFAWRRMSYDEKNRLRLTRYDDGSFETNACSCCRLLWHVDRTGAKTLRSATTGTDHLYWAEEEVYARDLPKDPYYMPDECPSTRSYPEGFPVRRHYADAFGRETNSVLGVEREIGIATNRTWIAASFLRAGNRTSYPEGVSDVSESVDARGLVRRHRRVSSPRAEMSVVSEEGEGIESASTTNVQYRGGGSLTVRVADGSVTRSCFFDDYGPDGCRISVSVREASDSPAVTNSVVRYDFLGRMIRAVTPVSDVAYSYAGPGRTEVSSFDSLSGLAVTNIFGSTGETVGTLSRGVVSRTDESYFFRSNVWWRAVTESASAGSDTNSLRRTETRLTGLSDDVRSEEVVYENGVPVSSSRVSFDASTHDEKTTVWTAENGVTSHTLRYGREIESVTPAEKYTTHYDNHGRRFMVRRPLMGVEASGRYRAYVWSAAGDLLREDEYCLAAGTGSATRWKGRGYAYDSRGNRVAETNEVGNVVVRAFDSGGRVTAEYGDTYSVRFGYDSAGRRVSLGTTRDGTDFDETRWGYDNATGDCIAKTYADGAGTGFTFASDGLPLRTTYPSGSWTERVYDGCRREIGQASSDPRCAFALALDAFGRTVAASNGVARFEYALANCGVATNEYAAVGGGSACLVRTVDVCGRMTSLGVDASRTDYRYDAANGVVASVSNADVTVRYRYSRDLMDLGYELELADGVCFDRILGRDKHHREQVLSVTNICGDAVSSMSYAYDLVSRPVSRGGDTFAYNRRGEVASATIAGNAATYVYDGIGNSTTSTWNGAATTYAANNLNQYESVDSAARSEYLSFGSDGEMIRHDDLLCRYDALSRLSVAYTNDVFAAAYAYDHLSRRVRKTARDGVHTYFYDGWKLVLELIEHDGVTDRVEYVWGKDISGSLDGAAGIGGLLYTKINGAIYVPQYDAYGNIISYCDAAGNIVASYTYDAFGRTIAQSGALADVFAFRYSTKYFDRETGFYYYGKRYYSPALRRWLTRDPIGENGGLNLYGFSENQAIMAYDCIGLSKYWENYPNFDDYESAGSVWELVGGNLYWGYITGLYYNSCALRVSRSLVQSGISPVKGTGRNVNNDFTVPKDVEYDGKQFKKGDVIKAETPKKRYVISAALIPALLDECLKDDLKEKKTWKNLEDAEKQRNCIEAAGQEAYFAAQGHVGMIKKGYKDPYYPYSMRGTIWILK